MQRCISLISPKDSAALTSNDWCFLAMKRRGSGRNWKLLPRRSHPLPLKAQDSHPFLGLYHPLWILVLFFVASESWISSWINSWSAEILWYWIPPTFPVDFAYSREHFIAVNVSSWSNSAQWKLEPIEVL